MDSQTVFLCIFAQIFKFSASKEEIERVLKFWKREITLKIAWSVRRWRSVKTKRGFLGAWWASGESSLFGLLEAEKGENQNYKPKKSSWQIGKTRAVLLSKFNVHEIIFARS